MLKPEVYNKIPEQFSGMHRWLGSDEAVDLWSRLCDATPREKWWTIRDALGKMREPYSDAIVARLRALIRYALEESGDNVVQRRRSGTSFFYRWGPHQGL